jgi:hypothetical protein
MEIGPRPPEMGERVLITGDKAWATGSSTSGKRPLTG